MTTITEFANELKQRAAGWRARSNTIFNGAIIAEEIQGWADKAAALSSPDNYDISQTVDGEWRTPPMEAFYRACCDCGLVHKEEYRVQEGTVQYRVTRDREETRLERERTGKNTLRSMPLQDHAVTQDKRHD